MITTDLSPEARRKRRREAIHESIDLALYDAEKDAADAWAQVDLLKCEIDKLKNEVQDTRAMMLTERSRTVKFLRAQGYDCGGCMSITDKIERGEHEG